MKSLTESKQIKQIFLKAIFYPGSWEKEDTNREQDQCLGWAGMGVAGIFCDTKFMFTIW